MLNEKGLIEFTNSFSRTKHEKHDKIIHRYKNNTKKRYITLTAINIKSYWILKYCIFLRKH